MSATFKQFDRKTQRYLSRFPSFFFYESQANICSAQGNESRRAIIYSSKESEIYEKIIRKLRDKEKRKKEKWSQSQTV